MDLRVYNGKVYLRDICLQEVAERYGTPLYLYDVDCVREKLHTLRRFLDPEVQIYYAVKANPNLELIREMRQYVDGLDIASAGEMEQSIRAGYLPDMLSFAGPGKRTRDLQEAVARGVGFVSVESTRELVELSNICKTAGNSANVGIRINPKLQIKEFAVKMGGKATQFGIDEEDIEPAVQFVKQHSDLFNFRGIHVYSGTQCMSEDAIAQNASNTLRLAEDMLKNHGLQCDVINIGGGFGISYYEDNRRLDEGLLSSKLNESFDRYRRSTGSRPRFIIELGRYLVAEAGIYVASVVSEKMSRGEAFYVLDGGMNHHLAASGNLGSTVRKNYLVRNLSNPGGRKEVCTLVGPLCTPLDLMGKGISVEAPRGGDIIGFLNSGSYGFTASPLLFLGHDAPLELLSTGGSVQRTTNRLIMPEIS